MAENRRQKPDMGGWYQINRQRVKYANFWVKKDGVLDRPDPSWSSRELNHNRTLHIEPWNVERISITGDGIELFQYAENYSHNNSEPGPKVLASDEIAWSVLFRSESLQNVCVREMKKLPSEKAKQQSTFIELCFNYKGLPESTDATRLKTEQPEDVAMGNVAEAKGAEMEEGKAEKGKVDAAGLSEQGGEAERGDADEGEIDEGEIEDEDAVDDEPLPSDQLNLAKLFAGPNDFSVLEVRLAFMRSDFKSKPYQWQWPAVFHFLRGVQEYTPRSKIEETRRQFSLPLNDWISQFGNKHTENFVCQPQEDGSMKWTIRSTLHRQQQQQQQQQLPSHARSVVPAFGAPLVPRPNPIPTPTPSQSSPSLRKRTLEDVYKDEEELDREEERLLARRRELREERRRLSGR